MGGGGKEDDAIESLGIDVRPGCGLRHEPPSALHAEVSRRRRLTGRLEASVLTVADGIIRVMGKEFTEEVDLYNTQIGRTLRKTELKFRSGSKRWTVVCKNEAERNKTLEVLNAAHAWRFDRNYKLGEKLGSGAFAVVYRCSPIAGTADPRVNPKEVLAAKVVDLKSLSKSDQKVVAKEVSILLECHQSENVVSCVDVFRTPSTVHIVMECLRGGDLFDHISRQQHPVSEDFARNIMAQLFRALANIHGRGIAHRDLKPENILLADADTGRPTIKVTDFGLAGRVNSRLGIGAVDDEELERFEYGTVGYMAPEIVLRKRHHTAVDMWACGCILYVLLSGKKPFSGKSHEEVCLKSSTGNFSFPPAVFKHISPDAISLTKSLLQLRPHLRLTAQGALCHSWFGSLGKAWLGHRNAQLPRPSFRARFRIAVYAVMFTKSWQGPEDALADMAKGPTSPQNTRDNLDFLRRALSGAGQPPRRSVGSLRGPDGHYSLRTSRRLSVLSDNTSCVLELGGRNTAVAE